MFCENCGNQIMDTQKFCGVCGTKNKTYKEVNVEDRMQETVKEDISMLRKLIQRRMQKKVL